MYRSLQTAMAFSSPELSETLSLLISLCWYLELIAGKKMPGCAMLMSTAAIAIMLDAIVSHTSVEE
jgi:hypothetical protein